MRYARDQTMRYAMRPTNPQSCCGEGIGPVSVSGLQTLGAEDI